MRWRQNTGWKTSSHKRITAKLGALGSRVGEAIIQYGARYLLLSRWWAADSVQEVPDKPVSDSLLGAMPLSWEVNIARVYPLETKRHFLIRSERGRQIFTTPAWQCAPAVRRTARHHSNDQTIKRSIQNVWSQVNSGRCDYVRVWVTWSTYQPVNTPTQFQSCSFAFNEQGMVTQCCLTFRTTSVIVAQLYPTIGPTFRVSWGEHPPTKRLAIPRTAFFQLAR